MRQLSVEALELLRADRQAVRTSRCERRLRRRLPRSDGSWPYGDRSESLDWTDSFRAGPFRTSSPRS
jgi:hypothetical protein